MTSLEAIDLSVEAGGLTVVEGLSFTLRAGDKVGVVGRNGAGKTSTLKVLAGEKLTLRPERSSAGARSATCAKTHGSIVRTTRSPDWSTSCPHANSWRWPAGWRRRGCSWRRSPPTATSDATHGWRTSTAALGGYHAESEARAITAGLGLAQDRLALPVGALSGGERRRLELARILFGGSDLLLLDEPTNHLDADAKAWLMKFLAGYKGGLMVVSHDIGLLDASITRILHLDRDGVVEYRGNYSQYREARARDEVRLAALAGRQEQEIRRLKTLADSMRGQTAKRARKAKTLDTRAAKLEAKKIAGPARERAVRFRFPEPPPCGRTVLTRRTAHQGVRGPAGLHRRLVRRRAWGAHSWSWG